MLLNIYVNDLVENYTVGVSISLRVHVDSMYDMFFYYNLS